MRKLNQAGTISTGTLVSIIVLVILWLGTSVFAVTAYQGQQDYKNNVQPKIDAAVAVAKKDTADADAIKFAEAEKNPLKTYSGPSAYGSVTVSYPKTWSAFVTETSSSSQPVDGFFHPGFVPATNVITNAFALRVQVLQTAYANQLRQFDGQVKTGAVKISAYSLPKNPGIVGVRVDGTISTGKQGSMVILPLRDTTLKVWTESNQFVSDFNNIILPNLSFVP